MNNYIDTMILSWMTYFDFKVFFFPAPKNKLTFKKESYLFAIHNYNRLKHIQPYIIPIRFDKQISMAVSYIGEDGSCVSKGTQFKNIPIVNWYNSVVLYKKDNDTKNIFTVRFGTPLINNPSEQMQIIQSNLKKDYPNMNVLYVSLFADCQNIYCDVYKRNKKLNDFIVSEANIVREEYALPYKKYFIPIRKQFNNTPGAFVENDNFIDLKNGESTFKAIVNISEYHYNNHENTVLVFHCKSGKDRTSMFDAINKATYFCLINKHTIDYEFIRKWTRCFLFFGLIIGQRSTGTIGLKLKNMILTDYIFKDNKQLLKFYTGLSSYI